MAGLVPGLVPTIHAAPLAANPKFFRQRDDVDDRDKPGHDGVGLLVIAPMPLTPPGKDGEGNS
jgi:hypothetical protein